MKMANNTYRNTCRSVSKKVVPEIEIVLSKQEVIYTDSEDIKHLVTRIQTNNKVYWIHNDQIIESTDWFDEEYKVLNRDSKIDKILLNNELE